MKKKFIDAYMDVAERFGKLSSAIRLNVGSIIVKNDRIISIGYNGMPSGWDNECEYKDYMSVDAGGWLSPDEIESQWPYQEEVDGHYRRYKLVSKPEVLHAETNAIAKLAKEDGGGDGATLFVTHAPCLPCAKSIYQAGICTVYYKHSYKDTSGVDFLIKSGVEVIHTGT